MSGSKKYRMFRSYRDRCKQRVVKNAFQIISRRRVAIILNELSSCPPDLFLGYFQILLSVRLQDVRYVIHTITFFAVSCPENSASFRKNRQIFEKI